MKSLVEKPQRIYGTRTDYAEKALSRVFGRKYIEYRREWVRASKRMIIMPFPLYIQIEQVARCNLRCPTCIQGIADIRKRYSRGLKPLGIGLYKEILSEAKEYKCPSISFHNNDEPLLLSDLATRIKLAREAGFIDIILTTNATLLNQERARELINSGVTKINFSVDAYEEPKYKTRRVGGDFKRVLKNIDYFIRLRKEGNLSFPITRVTCVLTKFNVGEIEGFRRFWSERVDMVEFQNFQAISGYTEGLRPPESKIDHSFVCTGPWQQIVIRPNGDVLPCCSFYGSGLVAGNITDNSIYDIWNGRLMQRLRKELIRGNFNVSSACRRCSQTFYAL